MRFKQASDSIHTAGEDIVIVTRILSLFSSSSVSPPENSISSPLSVFSKWHFPDTTTQMTIFDSFHRY